MDIGFWIWIAVAVVAAILIISGVILFLKLPSSTQIASMKEWLKYAVTMAEKELGSGTGQLKLRMVYEMFVEKFSWLASFISFEKFSTYVDEALEWLENQLTSNTAVSALVNGTETTEATEDEADEEATDDTVDLSSMTIKELKAYAEENGISLTGLRKKADIIAAIEAAEQEA